MQHEDSEDDYGFWEAEPTRTLRRVRPHHDEPTRQLRTVAASRRSARSDVVRPATRVHGLTGQVPVVAVVSARRSDSEDLPVSRRGLGDRLRRFRRCDNGRVDPLVARIAAILVIAAVGIPFASAVGGSSSASVHAAVLAGATTGQATPGSPAATTSTAGQPSGSAGITSAGITSSDGTSGTLPSPTEAATDSGESAAASASGAVTAVAPPKGSPSNGQVIEQVAPTCAKTYVVVAGDYWIGLADSAGVTLNALLTANGAQPTTPLYPGDRICLPAGATNPARITVNSTATAADAAVRVAPPTTPRPTNPPPTTPPSTTPVTRPPVTTPATTVPKPPSTTAAPQRTYTRDEVAQIIRSVWPAELADKAVAIATRESNLQPGVRNYCCYGLFQIYYSVHKSWLASIGVTNANQLFDPQVNAVAALTLYYRAGGWGPWGG